MCRGVESNSSLLRWQRHNNHHHHHHLLGVLVPAAPGSTIKISRRLSIGAVLGSTPLQLQLIRRSLQAVTKSRNPLSYRGARVPALSNSSEPRVRGLLLRCGADIVERSRFACSFSRIGRLLIESNRGIESIGHCFIVELILGVTLDQRT